MGKCYRCERVHISGEYKAKSSKVVTHRAKTLLGIDTNDPKGRYIECCLEHISPKSRKELHEQNIFERYEYQFLNYIAIFLEDIPQIKVTSFNEPITINGKVSRYDLYLSDAKLEADPKTALLIEIDETQHWQRKHFEEDRIREQSLRKEYPRTKIYILRIRVSEEEKKVSRCVEKKADKCYIRSGYEKQFKNNMKEVVEYIERIFTYDPSERRRHVYIDFATTDGLQEFPLDLFYKVDDLADTIGKMKV